MSGRWDSNKTFAEPTDAPAAHHASHEVAGGDAVAVTHAQTTGQGVDDHHNRNHADAQHTDGPNSKNPHGFADHTDRTRYVDVEPTALSLDAGVLGSDGAVPNAMPKITLVDAATQGGYFSRRIPVDAVAAQPLNLIIEWSAGTTVSGAGIQVSWSVNVFVVAPGGNVSSAGTTVAWLGDAGTKTAHLLVVETAKQILASVNAGDIVRVNLRRIGGDAADTLDGANVQVHRVRLAYTAEQ